MSSDTQKVELLFKKYSGAVDAYVGVAVGGEPPVSARPRIIPSLQLFSQDIPATAPLAGDLTTDGTFTYGVR